MSDRDVEVVREQFEAVNERDFPRAMELYSEDVVLIVPRIEGAQNPGTYRGTEAVGEWFGDWFRTFAPGYHFDLEEFRELDNGLVFLYARHGGKGRLSGAEVRGESFYLYRVGEGRVTQVGFFPSREDALEAASLPEWSETQTD